MRARPGCFRREAQNRSVPLVPPQPSRSQANGKRCLHAKAGFLSHNFPDLIVPCASTKFHPVGGQLKSAGVSRGGLSEVTSKGPPEDRPSQKFILARSRMTPRIGLAVKEREANCRHGGCGSCSDTWPSHLDLDATQGFRDGVVAPRGGRPGETRHS